MTGTYGLGGFDNQKRGGHHDEAVSDPLGKNKINRNVRYKKKKLTTEAAMGWKLATVGPNTSVDSMNNMARHWLTRLEWAKARPVKAAPAEPGSKTSGFNGFPIRRWP
jgi:hypothetical protein